MADDWQVGDLALCVKGGAFDGARASAHPKAGQVVTVHGMGVLITPAFPKGVLAMRSMDLPPNVNGGHLWRADRFIKVTPDEADAEDAETIRLMTGAPVREPTPC